MSVQKGLASWAGSTETYIGNNAIRVRRYGSEGVRVHVNADLVRIRPTYVAFEISRADLAALGCALMVDEIDAEDE